MPGYANIIYASLSVAYLIDVVVMIHRNINIIKGAYTLETMVCKNWFEKVRTTAR
ncbi:hypothetical protein BRYFOR_08542 [Marvinbryantia formatexigens DSM 14469]|uniref:Uncharacterized protein n=1 Tax=Marvinbryantia formatexigens DSM 14469 TaxID=478749 RepID=C6LIR2_9FIRM|nr:hypothetical protein BRYFOR_08542 [Marvinbryantia formatexigens DSM 14469]